MSGSEAYGDFVFGSQDAVKDILDDSVFRELLMENDAEDLKAGQLLLGYGAD